MSASVEPEAKLAVSDDYERPTMDGLVHPLDAVRLRPGSETAG